MDAAAIQIASALLTPLVTEIAAALAEGLDEEAATKRALERMAAQPIPEPVSGEIAERFRRARRTEVEASGAIAPLPPIELHDRTILRRILTSSQIELSREERDALSRAVERGA